MYRRDDVRKFLVRHLCHVRNLIDVTDHHDSLIGHGGTGLAVGAHATLETTKNTLALVLFAAPRVLILRSLLGRDDNVYNLGEPLGVSLTVVLKEQLLGSTHMIHLRLDQYETINVLVEEFEPQLQYVQLVIEHEGVTEHYTCSTISL